MDIDLGDLVSEDAHGVRTSSGLPRDFRVMPSGTFGPLFDGGVRLGGGDVVSFDLGRSGATHVALRFATLQRSTIRFAFDDVAGDEQTLDASHFWHELVVPIPAGAARMSILAASGRTLAAHAWLLAR